MYMFTLQVHFRVSSEVEFGPNCPSFSAYVILQEIFVYSCAIYNFATWRKIAVVGQNLLTPTTENKDFTYFSLYHFRENQILAFVAVHSVSRAHVGRCCYHEGPLLSVCTGQYLWPD